MNEDQKNKCHAIIHTHAVAAAAGNALPLPGAGVAVDLVTMTTLAMSLCAVFGGTITEEAAKTLAIASMKNTLLRSPIRVLTRELSKFVPGLGQIVAPSIAVVMIESAGWVLANDLHRKVAQERVSEKNKPKRRAPSRSQA